jgi:hypothetical protein
VAQIQALRNKRPSVQSRPKPDYLQAFIECLGTVGARDPRFLPGFQAQMEPPMLDQAFVGSRNDADLQGL